MPKHTGQGRPRDLRLVHRKLSYQIHSSKHPWECVDCLSGCEVTARPVLREGVIVISSLTQPTTRRGAQPLDTPWLGVPASAPASCWAPLRDRDSASRDYLPLPLPMRRKRPALLALGAVPDTIHQILLLAAVNLDHRALTKCASGEHNTPPNSPPRRPPQCGPAIELGASWSLSSTESCISGPWPGRARSSVGAHRGRIEPRKS